MAGNRKKWNDDLEKAMESRYNLAATAGQQSQFQWLKASQVIRGERKDIYRTQSGARSIVNLPNKLGKRAKGMCEDIIRGEQPVIPDGTNETLNPFSGRYAGKVQSRDGPSPTYLNKMQFRGGGYAILMAFHEVN